MLLERSHAVFFRFSSQRTMPMASSTKPRKPPPMANRIPPTAPKMPPMDTGGPTATGMPAQSISYSPEEGAVKESKDSQDRKSTRLNSSHVAISYAVFCLKKKQ